MMFLLGSIAALGAYADDSSVAYSFGPGDKLHITVLNNPDLSGEFTVQQSGGISLPSVGRIEVVGRGFDELQDEVVKRLRESGILDPQITVDVAAYRPVYVVGDVKAPGRYPFEMGMTVLQALAVAAASSRSMIRRSSSVSISWMPRTRSTRSKSIIWQPS
jgi:polysaccharide export outer membrane protein